MSAFRLLLCLSGLAIYFVFKQFIWVRPGAGVNPAAGQGLSAPQSQSQPAQSISQPESNPATRSLKPQTTPHSEWLKSGGALASQSGSRDEGKAGALGAVR